MSKIFEDDRISINMGVTWSEPPDTEAEPHAIGYRDYYRIHRHGDPVVDGQTIMDYLDYLAKRIGDLM